MSASSPWLDLVGLVCLAFVLGLRHGVDADHLAAIDGMARFNAATRPALARLTGLWFSVGHGLVVLAVAFGVASVAHAWDAPQWLEPFGAWASIVILLLLGVFNLLAVRRTPPGAVVAFEGWRSTLYGRVLNASGAWPILGVGALFAISFDTLSQAALMAVTGTAARGMLAVALLAGAFVVGMIVTDGLNGWFVASLMARSHRGAARASRGDGAQRGRRQLGHCGAGCRGAVFTGGRPLDRSAPGVVRPADRRHRRGQLRRRAAAHPGGRAGRRGRALERPAKLRGRGVPASATGPARHTGPAR